MVGLSYAHNGRAQKLTALHDVNVQAVQNRASRAWSILSPPPTACPKDNASALALGEIACETKLVGTHLARCVRRNSAASCFSRGAAV